MLKVNHLESQSDPKFLNSYESYYLSSNIETNTVQAETRVIVKSIVNHLSKTRASIVLVHVACVP